MLRWKREKGLLGLGQLFPQLAECGSLGVVSTNEERKFCVNLLQGRKKAESEVDVEIK